MKGTAPLLSVRLENEHDVVVARQRARRIAELLGFEEPDVVRIAAAVSEVARNAVSRSSGGTVEFRYASGVPHRLRVVVSDLARDGAVLRQQLDLGGAEVEGLIGCRRLMDHFVVEELDGGGVRVVFGKNLRVGHRALSPQALLKLTQELALPPSRNLVDELQRQNHDLLQALAETQRLQQDLAQLNRELQDTNRGVVALYAELDERADSLRKASEAKTRFLSNMTHEFRSPLNSILSLTRMLDERMDGELNVEQAKQVSFIRKAASDLSDLVNDLLDLARVEAGKVPVRLSQFSVADLLSTLRGTTRPLVSAQGEVALVFDEAPEGVVLRTDEGKLAQVLRNLISNAIKFTERGEVRVSCEAAADGQIAFHVSDTGVGIAAADHERIFEEFAQVEHPLQQKVKGTGLGLPLARRLTELLGGAIRVESEPGRGSEFTVQIPMDYAGPPDLVVAPEMPLRHAASPGSGSPYLLVVDDDEISRYLLRSSLEAMGFAVAEANGAEACFAALRRSRPAAVLLDVVMPGMSGLAVLETIRGTSALERLPVILHTAALLGDADRQFAAARGAKIVAKQFGERVAWESDLRRALQNAGLPVSIPA